MNDSMRHAAYRNPDAGPHLRPCRHLGQPLLQPVLMAVQEFFPPRLGAGRRHREAQALATGIDAQRQTPRTVVLDDLERQRAPATQCSRSSTGAGVGFVKLRKKPKVMAGRYAIRENE